jgi:hypothetical protein
MMNLATQREFALRRDGNGSTFSFECNVEKEVN